LKKKEIKHKKKIKVQGFFFKDFKKKKKKKNETHQLSSSHSFTNFYETMNLNVIIYIHST